MEYLHIPKSVNASSATPSKPSCSQNDHPLSSVNRLPLCSAAIKRDSASNFSMLNEVDNHNDLSASSSSVSPGNISSKIASVRQTAFTHSVPVTNISPGDIPPLPCGNRTHPRQKIPFIKEEPKETPSGNKLSNIIDICEKQAFDQSSYIQVILNICSQITGFPGFEPFCNQIISVCHQILLDTYKNNHEIIDICKNITNLNFNSQNTQNTQSCDMGDKEKNTFNTSDKETEKHDDPTEDNEEEFECHEKSDSEVGLNRNSDPDWTTDGEGDLRETDDEMKNTSRATVSKKTVKTKSCKDGPIKKLTIRLKGERKSRNKIGKGEYQCPECPRIFVNFKGFEKHQEHHRNGFKTTCEICGVLCPTPSHFKNHMRTHTGEKPFVCDVCGNAYAQISSLNSHLLSHSDERPIHCELCEYKCRTVKILKRHMVCHTNEKKYQCDNCGARFSRSGCLKKHLRIHRDEWPYPCDLCPKKFKNRVHLKRHEETHTDEYKFQCLVCGKRMRQSGNLKTHMRTHNGEKPYKCDICGMAFAHNVTRKQHQDHCNGRVEVLIQ